MQHHLTGAILTGGMARRLQPLGKNIDKGLVDLHGKPLVAWVADTLAPLSQQQPLLISANRYLQCYAHYGQVVQDPTIFSGYQGPLAGLYALLSACTTDWLMVLPVDTPFVPFSVVQRFWQTRSRYPLQRAFFARHERDHPLCLLLHRSCAPHLATYLQQGQRRVFGWLQQQEAVAVDMHQFDATVFLNLNTPEDLENARQQAFSARL